MKDFIKPVIGPAIALAMAGAIVGAAGSAGAGSSGKSAPYPPVPAVNKNTAIPKKDPLTDRPALAPKSGAVSGAAGGKTGAVEQGPRLGAERPAPERQIPDTPVEATAGPAGANGTAGTE